LLSFKDAPRGSIIGNVVVERWTDKRPPSRFADDEGPYWILADAIAFAKPIPVLGKLNLWRVPDEIRGDALREIARAGRQVSTSSAAD
jgi:hypothetical protein